MSQAIVDILNARPKRVMSDSDPMDPVKLAAQRELNRQKDQSWGGLGAEIVNNWTTRLPQAAAALYHNMAARGADNEQNGLVHGALRDASDVGSAALSLTGLPAFKHGWENSDPRAGADPNVMNDAMGVAGSLFAASGVASHLGAQTGDLGVFAGRAARTADLPALGRAQASEAAGAPRADIWRDTGWHKGLDGQWKWEIDDSGASSQQKTGRLSKALDHPDLYAAYPDIAKIPTNKLTGMSGFMYGGGYRPAKPQTTFQKIFGGRDKGKMLYSEQYTGDDLTNKLLHESQHGIQDPLRESFADGGSSDGNTDFLTPTQRQMLIGDEVARLKSRAEVFNPKKFTDPADQAKFGREYNRILNTAEGRATEELPRLTYDNLAGEVEARAVESRRLLTADQRRARPPWLDYDVPENKQIVRFGDNGVQHAYAAYHGSPHSFDKFSMDNIGTGEGAQAVGHGLYFAGNENVAKYYADKLSFKNWDRDSNAIHLDGKLVDGRDPVDLDAGWQLSRFADNGVAKHGQVIHDGNVSYDAAISDARQRADAYTRTAQDNIQNAWPWQKKGTASSQQTH